MSQGYDPFEDVRGLGDLGILQGLGATEHQKARVAPDPEGKGVCYTLNCDHCGNPNRMTIGWEELAICANRAVPPKWRYEAAHGACHPNIGCANCRRPLLLMLTPDECGGHVQAGVLAGKISQGWVNGLSQQVQQQMAQYRR